MMTIPLEIGLQEPWKKKVLRFFKLKVYKKELLSVKEKKPAFAVVDLRLADGNGLEVVKQIQILIQAVEL